jgi:trans-aconitate methyltransferase
MCQRVKGSLARWHFADTETTSVLGALFAVQPKVALDALFPLGTAPDDHIHQIRYQMGMGGGSAFDNVPEQVLLEWCDQGKDIRYPLMASAIFPFQVEAKTEIRHWTKAALSLLEYAPDRIEVLKRYIEKLQPMGWSGSQVPPWEANVKLLDFFAEYPDPNIIAFAAAEKARLLGVLDLVRQREASEERRENERFE